MKDSLCTNDSYVKNSYKKEDLFEGTGGSKTLSDFLDLIVSNDGAVKNIEYQNVGSRIHQEIMRNGKCIS